jgi:hypothetical protein
MDRPITYLSKKVDELPKSCLDREAIKTPIFVGSNWTTKLLQIFILNGQPHTHMRTHSSSNCLDMCLSRWSPSIL